MAEQQPGKINKGIWENNNAGNNNGNQAAQPVGNASKVAMFEQAAKDAGPKEVVKKKTWANSGNSGGYANQGKYKGKTQIGNGPPPKKSVADLP